MEEKLNPVVEHPAATTDPAPNESSSSTPEVVTEQGVSAAEADLAQASTDHANTDTSSDTSALEADQSQASNQDSSAPASLGNPPSDSLTSTPAADTASTDTAGLDTTSVDTASASSMVSSDAESDVGTSSSDPASQAASAIITPDTMAASSDAAAISSDTGTSTNDTSTNDTSTDDASMEGMTMEDVMAASDDQLTRKPIHRGMILNGSVIMLSQDGLVVDVGAKIEGLVPYNQLFEFEVSAEDAAKYFKSGDEMQVYVVRADIPNSTIILSKRRADQERAWNLLSDIYEKKLPVEVEVVEKVRGGLVANLGVRAFLPASQVDVRRVNELDPYVGKRLKVRIIELNRKRNRVIISRRSIIEEELSEKKEETLKKLEPGAKLEGEVVEITDFGVFVNLGGIDGLVHRSEIGHGRFNHPKEVLELGQKVNVEVLDMDLERERINLSMKSLISDPWENVLANYVIGQKVSGVVTNLTPFGAFVEIEAGLEGLIHVSEMSWTKRIRHPKEVVTEGDHVDAMVLKIDVGQKRISLGLRQTQPDPWSSLPDRFPPGTEVTGPITGITDFGVFMEIEEGIEGLIHISELAHEHIDNISEHFKRGDEVNAAILNIDPVEQRASLSRKRLLPYTADMDAAGDAPAAGGQRPGGRKGRRGGRRSAGIDYDYSYAASDTGAKATAKLGDVYADLFAQFGLTDSADESSEDTSSVDATAEAIADTPMEPSANVAPPTDDSAQVAEVTALSDDTQDAQSGPEASAEAGSEDTASADVASSDQPLAETPAEVPEVNADTQAEISDIEASAPDVAPDETSEDADNVIDAAEAAALLTAAFREGKRPANQQDDAQQSPEASAEPESASEETPQQPEDDTPLA